jgi:hypothetical protein
MMKRVLVLVEGQTEERFIKDMLCPHLWPRDIDLTPTLAVTKRVKDGTRFKGGITSYPKAAMDVRLLLMDTNAAAVTTFVDYYGLPPNFPGMASRPDAEPVRRAVHVETEWAVRIGNPRFHPYLMVHEFEALLFSKPKEISIALHAPKAGEDLEKIRSTFVTPEGIDDGPETAPSKRIMRCCPGYQKAVHGPMVAQRIGLPDMRGQCPHFNEWLAWLEGL